MKYLSFFIVFFAMNLQAQDYVQESYREELYQMAKQNHRPVDSYSYARKAVLQNLHLKQDKSGYYVKDVYCLRDFRRKVGPNSMPNHTEINIEHTWPQSRFNKRFNKHIQKVDLHHLYPSDSRSNSSRGNHYFSQFNKHGHPVYAECLASKMGMISETGQEGFEPPEKHKGNVARALFYFSIRYQIKIPAYEEFFLRQWHLIDPVDEEEKLRNLEIEKLQGNRNIFIDDPELTDLITDF